MQLLSLMKWIKESGVYEKRDISNAISVVWIALADLFSADSDLFVAGHAGRGAVAVLLYHRSLLLLLNKKCRVLSAMLINIKCIVSSTSTIS